ncbi:MAG: transglycosylase domain-containing protein [Clostridia bacterium]|nr:transglycosylase domain-containing protein [Clostridia bacterium]
MDKRKNNSMNKSKKANISKVRKVRKVDKDLMNNDDPNMKKKKKHKKGWKIFRICLFVFLALCIVAAGIILGVITGIIDKTDSIDLEDINDYALTSFVYDKNEQQIGAFSGLENRVLIEYKDLPKHLIDAVISIEDERFTSHKGVDIKRTLGAIVTYVLNGGKSNFGGSTITQQLVKNVTDDKDSSWTRKIREWYRAFSLEKLLDKDQIMVSYLNTIYLGEGSYGISVASETYFGKPVNDLNLAESAVMAAAIQSPEATNPYAGDEAKQKLLARQKVVLKKMLDLGKITQVEYDDAMKVELAFHKSSVESKTVQSYYVDAVYNAVLNDLIEEKGYDAGLAKQKLYGGGLKIYTPMDQDVQKAIDEAYKNNKLFYTDKNGKFMQSAMVVMEQSTGNVVGLIGGADEKKGDLVLNRAVSEPRQPGSCMKPIGAYGPAFELGKLSPGSGIDDSPLVNVQNGPGNYYGYFNGYVTVRSAIAKSMNLPAIRAHMKVDPSYAITFAKNMGLKHLVTAKENAGKNDESYSFALGGLTKGATVLEMANAYATIANQGVHIEPKLYTKVVDNNGKEVLNNNSSTAKVVMKDSTAYMLTNSLEEVVKTGTAAGYVKMKNGMAVAGKTGNTDNDRDQWFCGFTPYYTIACWNGYDYKDGAPAIGYRKIGSYPYTSVNLFNTVANAISQGKEVKGFNKPGSITTAPLCKVSGLVATDACRTDPRGNQTGTDIIAKDSIPTETCNIHKVVKICTVSGLIANNYCSNTENRSFITREGVPAIKPSDWKYMLPTATCNVHNEQTKKEEEENNKPKPPKPDDGVDIY